MYRKGASYGLYRVQLDETAPDYLEMTRVIDGASLSMRVADMAINPADEFGYAVSSTGELFQIDLETGAGSVLSNVGQSGGFGAAYFDPEGNLYIGRNNDGSIFRRKSPMSFLLWLPWSGFSIRQCHRCIGIFPSTHHWHLLNAALNQ